jgi:3-hydroxyacyl-[acyl-carrier-protein] dehydratase
MSAPLNDDILQRIVLILRRDLKLGADVDIPDDMPFFGSDVDLDSLDILLLVTSIEKEFGIKIPSEAVGKEVFQNVSTLVRYIQDRAAGDAGAGASGPGEAGAFMPRVDYLVRLPHADPFRFVSKVTTVKEGELAEGTWALAGNEPFFAGHFPGNPMVPGVLIAESLAQISGLAMPIDEKTTGGKLAQVDVRFEQPVTPPAEITLKSKLTRAMPPLYQFDVTASVGDAVVAKGSLTLLRG